MIVVDIETSGMHYVECGIFQIGAIDTDNPENHFVDECRIDDDDIVIQEALDVTGKTEKYLRDTNKQSQKQLLEKFITWCGSIKIKNFVCQNPQFDFAFIKIKTEKYGLQMPVHFRCFDLHTAASLKYVQVYGQLLTRNNHSDMGLPNVLRFCGMEDDRTTHDALEDAELTAECLSRIFYGKNLLKKFEAYAIPKYLKEQYQNR